MQSENQLWLDALGEVSSADLDALLRRHQASDAHDLVSLWQGGGGSSGGGDNTVVVDLASEVRSNENYRRVLVTGNHGQLVEMSLLPGQEIGIETHDDTDQFLYVVSGRGECTVDGNTHQIRPGWSIFVHAGSEHNVVNTSRRRGRALKLVSVYAPPEHPDGLTQLLKP